MHYGMKRAIIIASIVIGILLILGIGGTILYLKTDIFKSNQSLFFKYIEQAAKGIEYTPNTNMTKNINRIKEEPFTLVGNLSYETDEKNNATKNALKNMKFIVEAKVDNPEKKAYGVGTLKSNNQDLFKLEYANTNNIYALKSDEVVTAFIGVENQNLKVLAQKLGITNTSNIPNSIAPILNLGETLNLTEDEKSHIYETYMPVLEQNIEKSNFTKNKDIAVSRDGVVYNTIGYRLELSASELKQIEIKLLQALKEDSITLNLITTKAKTFNLEEKYTQINNLVQEIDSLINKISNESTNSQDGIIITVYVENGKVVTTEIIYKNETKYTIYGQKENNANSYYILIENLSATEEYNKIEIKTEETSSNNASTLSVVININNEKGIEIYLENINDNEEDILKTNCEVTINEEDNKNSILSYEQEIAFKESITDIINIDRNSCAVLNDYPTEQLQVLVKSLVQRVQELINQKAQAVGIPININIQNNTDTINNTENSANNTTEE